MSKTWPAIAAKYNEQERIMAGRNSYSKTSPSVTFMRMKEAHGYLLKNASIEDLRNAIDQG